MANELKYKTGGIFSEINKNGYALKKTRITPGEIEDIVTSIYKNKAYERPIPRREVIIGKVGLQTLFKVLGKDGFEIWVHGTTITTTLAGASYIRSKIKSK